MKRALPIALVAAFVLALMAFPALANTGHEIVAVRVSQAPEVDGTLNDAAWLQAALSDAVVSGFVNHTGTTLLIGQTVVYAAWDAEALYLAYANYRDMSKVTMMNDGAVSFGAEEENELYVDANLDRATFVQYAWDAYGAKWASNGVTTGMEVATTHIDQGWIAEVKLPWSLLGVSNPEVGTKIGLNFNGYSTQDRAYFAWSPTYGPFANPPQFGVLVLGDAYSR